MLRKQYLWKVKENGSKRVIFATIVVILNLLKIQKTLCKKMLLRLPYSITNDILLIVRKLNLHPNIWGFLKNMDKIPKRVR
ncbi:hypothetical protein [uncultured Methanolobus sp.]|uniref:hypothetical protein n=1 Tax=uncultured Methanolobus sp. TaxID=218300 RepID=UPI0029C8CE85|nr:hypothetical protein [uncultured Methanolobus sp.]